MNFQSFSDEQARVIVNLDQAYQVGMGLTQAIGDERGAEWPIGHI